MSVTDLLLAARVVVGPDPVYTNGQVGELSMNQDGRLRVSTKPGFFDVVTGALTAAGGATAVDVTDASNVVLHIKNTGTAAMAAGVLAFEGSVDSTNGTDGTWFAIQGCRTNSNTIETQTPTLSMGSNAGYASAWEFSVNALRWMRVRVASSVTTNSIAFVTLVRGTYATEPVPAIQTHAVTGSGNFNTVPGSGSNYNLESAASTNAAVVRNTAASLTEITVFNPTGAPVYVKLYNQTSAPTVGTSKPILTIPVVPNELVAIEFGTIGKRFTSGIAIAITAGAAATDTAAITAGVQVNATYV